MRISDWSSDVCSSDLAVIGELSVVLAALSEGELGRSMHGEYRGVFGGLKRSANDLDARLAEFAGRLGRSTTGVRSASAELSHGAADLARRTQRQASTLEDTADANTTTGRTSGRAKR